MSSNKVLLAVLIVAMLTVASTFHARANDVVNLAEGTSFTVPAGEILIITDYTITDVAVARFNGSDQLILRPRIRIDGVDVWGTGYHSWGTGSTSASSTTDSALLTHELESGIMVHPDEVVTLHANPFFVGTAWPTTPVMFATGMLVSM